ncbi:hypothetical protein CR513_00684, partial [Mucuna pruriens]
MTNRVRHLATSARKRNVVLVEAFFPLLVKVVKGARDVRGVRAFRTTTGLVVLGRIPLLNIRDRGKVAGPIISKEKEPGYLFHSTFRPPDSTDFLITRRLELICFDQGKSPVSHQLGAGHACHVPSIAPNLCRFWRTVLHPGELMRFRRAQRPEASPFTVRRTNTIRRLHTKSSLTEYACLSRVRQNRCCLMGTPPILLSMSSLTVPISTNRCFQIRLPVDISSNSSIREANCCVKESISRHKPRGRSCATPPGRYAIDGRISSGSPLLAEMNGSEGGAGFYFRAGGSVRLRMRTSFPSAHSPFTRFSKQRRKGGQQVPRALCPTHLSRSKCSSPVPPNAPISRQRSCECAVMLRMLRHRIDRPSSRSFPVHSLYISDTQGRTRWEGSSPSLCPADHSAGILHSRLRLTAARGWSCRYVSLSGSLAPPVISFYDMLLSSPYSICNLVISASLRVSTSERNGGLHSALQDPPTLMKTRVGRSSIHLTGGVDNEATFTTFSLLSLCCSKILMVGFNRNLFHRGQRGMPLYMLHRSMLLGKRLPLDPPLEHEGRIHKRLSIMKVCLWLCIYLCLLDQWLKLLLLQRFSCDLFSFRPCSCTHLKVQYLNAPSALGKGGPRLILMLSSWGDLSSFRIALFKIDSCNRSEAFIPNREGLLVITEGMTKELLLRAIDFPTEMERMRSYSLSIADAKTKRA